MIIWIASYPKSGNTWVRAFISAYYYTEDGIFDPKKLELIPDYPNQILLKNKEVKHGEIYKFWESSQKDIALKKKIKFLKTHNALIEAHGKPFTSSKYSLGAIYIVRDPRNVITSIKNHYDFKDYKNALNFMMDKNTYVWGFNNNYAKSQIITSWQINYLSWIEKNNYLKTILIKYEDLNRNSEKTFKNIIKFINQITKNNEPIIQEKLHNAIATTNFKNMQKIEREGNFRENVHSEKTLEQKKFFHLGPKNDWKKLVDKEIIEKINNNCKDEMLNLNYKK